jgi:hypothetical protein
VDRQDFRLWKRNGFNFTKNHKGELIEKKALQKMVTLYVDERSNEITSAKNFIAENAKGFVNLVM